MRRGLVIAGALVGAVITVSLFGCFRGRPSVAVTPQEATESALWMSYERAIKDKLKDPDSAKFSHVNYFSGGPTQVLCGYVNSKNAFGGYTGPRGFIYSGNVVLEENARSKDWASVVRIYCKPRMFDRRPSEH